MKILKIIAGVACCILCMSSVCITASAAESSDLIYCNPSVSWLRTDSSETTGNEIRHVYSGEYVKLIDTVSDTWGYVSYPCNDGNTYTGYVKLSEYNINKNSSDDMIEILKSEFGFNDAAAVAVYVNMYYESAGNPEAYCIDTNNLQSYGLCQWNGPRYESLREYCFVNNLDIHTRDAQLLYLKHELDTDYKTQYDYMLSVDNSASGCYDATYYWASRFEICSSDYWNMRACTAYDVYTGVKTRLF